MSPREIPMISFKSETPKWKRAIAWCLVAAWLLVEAILRRMKR